MAEKKPSFEESLAELEKIVSEMESGELSLDVLMAKFETGRKLVAACTAELESIRRRIEKVVASEPPKVEAMDIV